MLKAELSSYWDWELAADGVDAAVDKYMGQKVSLLRAFCQRTGIQVTKICKLLFCLFIINIFFLLDFDERVCLRNQKSQYVFRRRYH